MPGPYVGWVLDELAHNLQPILESLVLQDLLIAINFPVSHHFGLKYHTKDPFPMMAGPPVRDMFCSVKGPWHHPAWVVLVVSAILFVVVAVDIDAM
jgi:hypothetical protein